MKLVKDKPSKAALLVKAISLFAALILTLIAIKQLNTNPKVVLKSVESRPAVKILFTNQR